jgi:hypothetical protein
MNCQICNRAGLQEDTSVCPQCNSDLSSFALLQKIQNSVSIKQSNNKWIFIIVGLSLCFAFVYWFSPRTITKTIEVTREAKNDSVEYYKSEIAELKKNKNQAADTNNILKYIVKQNDNLGKISKLIFNDYKHIDQIVKENRIQNQNVILVGDVLFIDLSEKKQ